MTFPLRRVRFDASTGCIVWTGGKSGNGYGQLTKLGRTWMAHRLAYELLRGTVPRGLDLDHLCRNRACVRPDHLEPVTRSENIKRGAGPRLSAERQLSKTHCPQGHPYDDENTYRFPDGRRGCRKCGAESSRLYRERTRYARTA